MGDNRWRIDFSARRIGALGVKFRTERTVTAETEEQALLSLYDKFEHITVFSIRRLHEGES